MGFISVKNQEA